LIIFKGFPIFYGSSCMGNADGATHEIGDGKDFEEFLLSYAQFITSTQVILYAIVTTKNHRGD
jgi:hypothetical protein